MDRGDLLGRKAAAREPDLVYAGIVRLAVGNDDIGRDILPDKRTALYHGVVADMHPLVHGRMAAYDDPVADFDLAGERGAVGQHAMAAQNVVVSDMYIGQKEVVAAHHRRAARSRAARYGHIFAYVVIVADDGRRLLAGELQVLRLAGDRGAGMYPVALADARTVVDSRVGTYPAVVAYDHVALDVGEGLDGHVAADDRIGVYVC